MLRNAIFCGDVGFYKKYIRTAGLMNGRYLEKRPCFADLLSANNWDNAETSEGNRGSLDSLEIGS